MLTLGITSRRPAMSSTRAAPPVELDFLGLRAAAGEHHSKSSNGSASSASSSIRGMETSAIARIDPRLLRRVVVARPPLPSPPAPVVVTEKEEAAAAAAAASPMAVLYNGSVAVFDVSHHKAEAIIRMATEVTTMERRGRGNALATNFAKDVPLARTKSLQQFLVKRKERLTRLRPYQMTGDAVGATTKSSDKSFRVKKEAAEA